jgi:hypothetical protein
MVCEMLRSGVRLSVEQTGVCLEGGKRHLTFPMLNILF